MATYYVDDGGDGSDGLTWAKAYTSINALDTAVALASGDIVYFGHDHNCAAVNGAALTITGPASGLPVIFISATQGSNPPTYTKGTGTQIDTSEAVTYDITFDGSFSLYGLKVKSGRQIVCSNDTNESFHSDDCTFMPGATGYLGNSTQTRSRQIHRRTVVDLTQDGTTSRTTVPIQGSGSGTGLEFDGLTFVNAAYRTGAILAADSATRLRVAGADFSGFTNATTCEIFALGFGAEIFLENCITVASPVMLTTGTPESGTRFWAANVGPADDPTNLYYADYFGSCVSSNAIYRSSGATIEGDACSWLITTRAECSEASSFTTPWIYGKTTNGSKTFAIFITNDTADFDDDEVWIEVDYLSAADESLWTLADDHRATILTTPAAQTDDVTSTWNGAGPSYTYKQKLSVTATVGETGEFRARVVVGLPSIAGSRFFYIDPLVTVT